jgi:pantoate--beta-alanine ligase
VNVIETIDGFRKTLDAERLDGKTVGLVPTMGFLHEGHVALMRRAATECDVAAATIFVNPLQFAAGEDLSTYPRDIDGDTRAASDAGIDHLFVPDLSEMYPGDVHTTVSVAGESDGLEGASRPTHFAGVATVVAKLFNIAGPCRAYFGEKDWQQLQVVRRMVADLSFPIEVVGCPIVRADDGLALSSRNAYLSSAERAAAPVLHRALVDGLAAVERGVADREAADVMARTISAEPLAQLDYAEVVGDRLLVAARFGSTRLIDNLGVTR